MLTGGVLGQSILFLTYPFLGPTGLLVVRIVQVFLGAASTLATTIATEDPVRSAGQGLGSLSLWGGVGGVLGVIAGFPFLAGTEFKSHSAAAVGLFALLALLSGASVVCLALSGDLARSRAIVRVREALRFRSGPWVVRLSLASVIVGIANYTVYALFPLFVRNVLSSEGAGLFGATLNPTQQLALLSIGAGIGGILISPATGRWVERPRLRRWLFLAAPLVYALLWVGFALLHSYAAIFLIWSFPAAVLFQLPLTRGDRRPHPVRGTGPCGGSVRCGVLLRGTRGFGLRGTWDRRGPLIPCDVPPLGRDRSGGSAGPSRGNVPRRWNPRDRTPDTEYVGGSNTPHMRRPSSRRPMMSGRCPSRVVSPCHNSRRYTSRNGSATLTASRDVGRSPSRVRTAAPLVVGVVPEPVTVPISTVSLTEVYLGRPTSSEPCPDENDGGLRPVLSGHECEGRIEPFYPDLPSGIPRLSPSVGERVHRRSTSLHASNSSIGTVGRPSFRHQTPDPPRVARWARAGLRHRVRHPHLDLGNRGSGLER